MGNRTALEVVARIQCPLYVVTMLGRIGHRLTYNRHRMSLM